MRAELIEMYLTRFEAETLLLVAANGFGGGELFANSDGSPTGFGGGREAAAYTRAEAKIRRALNP